MTDASLEVTCELRLYNICSKDLARHNADVCAQ